MVLNTVDIIGSKWLSQSIPGALDLTEELMVFVSILPIAYVLLERDHIRITMVEERVSDRMRKALTMMSYCIGLIVMGFMTWRVFYRFLSSVESMELKKGLDLPTWPGTLAVVIGFAFLTLVFLLLLIRTFRTGKGSTMTSPTMKY